MTTTPITTPLDSSDDNAWLVSINLINIVELCPQSFNYHLVKATWL